MHRAIYFFDPVINFFSGNVWVSHYEDSFGSANGRYPLHALEILIAIPTLFHPFFTFKFFVAGYAYFFHRKRRKETPQLVEGRNCDLHKLIYMFDLLYTGEIVRKTILLNCLPLTAKKRDILDSFFAEYLRVLNLTFEQLPNAKSFNNLHHLTYSNIRSTSFLPSDIVQEARKDVWAKRKTVKSGFKRCSIRLNNRWFKFFKTNRGTPCFRITYSPRKTFVIPIKIDGEYDRFNNFLDGGWDIKSISLLNGRIAVSLKKDFSDPISSDRYVIGVDVGSSTLAAVTVYDTVACKVIKQLYFGRDVAVRQKRFEQRRAKLQSLAYGGSERARKSLERCKRKQSNYVKTRSGQVAKEIVNLATKYNASIAIEKLEFRATKGKIGKNGRKKINKIPYAQLRDFLISNCEECRIFIHQIDAYHTSKWCPRCGSVNSGHSSVNYALYVCSECGMIVNSDRKASLAIAIKSALERELSQDLTNLFSQFSSAEGAVNHLFRPDDERFSSLVDHT